VLALGAFAAAPLAAMTPEIVTGNFEALNISNADVLGSGTFLIFLSMLAVTPLITITGARWFAPLRWWFGIMFFATAVIDLIIASIVTGDDFKGGFLGRIAGHIFLLIGTTTVLLSIVLVITASHRAQKRLGKYWKPIQKITYVVWALILIHLLLLFGIGEDRFQQAVAASYPLFVLRLPSIKNWVIAYRRSWIVWVLLIPLLSVFVFGYGNLINEFVDKGVQAASLNPVDD
jgi:DMSO/TMAO reductase YedYZ heme-binding membrane subunit